MRKRKSKKEKRRGGELGWLTECTAHTLSFIQDCSPLPRVMGSSHKQMTTIFQGCYKEGSGRMEREGESERKDVFSILT